MFSGGGRATNNMTTIGNELRQERFNRKANAIAGAFLALSFLAALINWASNLN